MVNQYVMGVITLPVLFILFGLLSSNRYQIAIAYDQLINAYLKGWADETLSARAWRNRNKNTKWKIALYLINKLFFWQENHCRGAYFNEKLRQHLPVDYRQ